MKVKQKTKNKKQKTNKKMRKREIQNGAELKP